MVETPKTLMAVPNLSEGRDSDLVARVAAAARREDVRQLDLSSDADHNRSVLTLMGPPRPLVAAGIELAEMAKQHLDLRRHRGVHPRLGALDVLPFVYLQQDDRNDAIDAARSCARAIAERCDLPVLLYGDASASRRSLPELRRGGSRGLASRLRGGQLQPDFGPSAPHRSAGVVCVGARPPLIAFNLWLDADLGTARRIAASIRESTPGGLPGIRALGLALESHHLSQVSVNVIDHRATTLPVLVARVRAEAARLGGRVERSELIGLCPRSALDGASAEELLLHTLEARQIIESHLEAD